MSNLQMLENLLADEAIALQDAPFLRSGPGPMPADFDFGRVEGMMLGLALGDALGNATEGHTPSERRWLYGEIRDYVPERPLGLPSDDTQLAFWTLEQALADGSMQPARLAARFCREHIYGLGGTVAEFIENYTEGTPWYECGPRSAGNGALMRIAPALIPHLRSGTADLWADTALSAMLTHNDSGSTSACVAFVYMLWELLQMSAPPAPEWWVSTYVRVATQLETDNQFETRGGNYVMFQGPLWRFVAERVPDAHARGLNVRDACDEWHSGAFLLETLPSVLYILTRHGHDPEEAIVRAVNDTWDNDTIAAIVGAAVGALHGRAALPSRWLQGLLGRTRQDDDGRVFELLAEARVKWAPMGSRRAVS